MSCNSLGQFAWSQKIAQEEQQAGLQFTEQRNERNTAQYVPTFFTQPDNHRLLTEAARRPPVSRKKMYFLKFILFNYLN